MPLFVANDNNLVLRRVRNKIDNTLIVDADIEVVLALWTSDREMSSMVSAVTSTSPIEITTSAPHGLVTGQEVLLTRVRGVLSANGRWNITVTSPTTFTLDGSVGSGTYRGGGKWWETLVDVPTLRMTYFEEQASYICELDQSAPLIPGYDYLVFFMALNYDFQIESKQKARTRVS